MSENIVIAGVGMIPFNKPGQSESYDVMGGKATRAALTDANIDYDLIQQAYAGYVYGDSCAGQAALYRVGITGVPIFNVNNNCASGSSAFYLASQAVKTGAVECALAVGFEEMTPGAIEMVFPEKTPPLQRHTEAVGRLMNLTEEEMKLPPAVVMFGCQVDATKQELGIGDEVLAQIAVKARTHAKHNPYAIFRDPISHEAIMESPSIYRGLKKLYACPPSCGAAAVIVCSEAFAKKHGIDSSVQVIGQGVCSDSKEYFEDNVLDVMFRALSRDAANEAYEQAGVGPDDIDVIELHDCFTSNEILTYSALGLCADSDMEKFVMEGRNTYGGDVVVCPSGGLLSKGHPLGATGLSQLTELVWHLRGTAGERQVEGARTALQHNGGLGSAGFVNILQRS
ncbi:thiolase C-terminal domain-containing protein [Amphritea sp. HPY]|uniref:thiolase C-terminal domain-containing protein n=1 Tax=Amphritea sp. HPY TaxID=3421652 RepID=UPI003D7E4DC2